MPQHGAAKLNYVDEAGDRKQVANQKVAEKRKLTQAWCRKADPPAKGRRTVYDQQTPHLAIVITPSGSRSWYWIGRVNGRSRRIRLSDNSVSLETARKMAVQTTAEVSGGSDPMAERRKRREQVTTLAELWQVYGEERERSPRTVTAEASLWKHIGSALEKRQLDSIQPEEVAALHARIGKQRGRVTANRVAQLLRRLYRFARRRRLYTGDNPAEGLELYPEKSRERFVKPAELPALLDAIDHEPEPWPDYFKLALLTGARRSALAAMRWADLDLQAGAWRMPAEDSKNAEAVTVALVDDAVELLRRRRGEAQKDDDGNPASPHVFASRSAKGHVVNPYNAWVRIRDRAGLPDVTLHDVRRTTGSYLAAAGVSLPIIGKALGHRSQTSTAVYARLNVDDVRQELRHVQQAMNQAANGNSKGTGDE